MYKLCIIYVKIYKIGNIFAIKHQRVPHSLGKNTLVIIYVDKAPSECLSPSENGCISNQAPSITHQYNQANIEFRKGCRKGHCKCPPYPGCGFQC